jgi:Zn-dependent oligopeptidase
LDGWVGYVVALLVGTHALANTVDAYHNDFEPVFVELGHALASMLTEEKSVAVCHINNIVVPL